MCERGVCIYGTLGVFNNFPHAHLCLNFAIVIYFPKKKKKFATIRYYY